jgi:hypothetical protein
VSSFSLSKVTVSSLGWEGKTIEGISYRIVSLVKKKVGKGRKKKEIGGAWFSTCASMMEKLRHRRFEIFPIPKKGKLLRDG